MPAQPVENKCQHTIRNGDNHQFTATICYRQCQQRTHAPSHTTHKTKFRYRNSAYIYLLIAARCLYYVYMYKINTLRAPPHYYTKFRAMRINFKCDIHFFFSVGCFGVCCSIQSIVCVYNFGFYAIKCLSSFRYTCSCSCMHVAGARATAAAAAV